jgi:hypothetical protein
MRDSKQYHGCRDEKQATHYAFQMSVEAQRAIRCRRIMVVWCVCHASGQRSPRHIGPSCPPLLSTCTRIGMGRRAQLGDKRLRAVADVRCDALAIRIITQ